MPVAEMSESITKTLFTDFTPKTLSETLIRPGKKIITQ